MRLKAMTATFLALCFAMLVGWPWLMGPPPSRDTPVVVRKEYLSRASWYVGIMGLSLVAAGVGAILILRRAKEDFRLEAKANMRELIDSARDAQRHDG